MTLPRLRPFALAFLLAGQNCAPKSNDSQAKPKEGNAALSDAVRAARPKGGEWFGLYLVNKKVGYYFTNLEADPADKSRVISTQIFYFNALVGGSKSERKHSEYRTYEAKPNGKLLSLTIEARGDGGDQTMEGTSTADGVHIIIKRPGQPNQVRNLPPTRETVEDVEQERVAVMRGKRVDGVIIDGLDLDTYKVWTTFEKPEERLIRGSKVKLNHVRTFNEKDHVGSDKYLTESGEMLEADFGQTMKALAEPEAVAKKIDQVDVFGLIRVVLPKPISDPRIIPNQVTMTVTGLPELFWKNDYRQTFKKLPGDEVAVTVRAAPPEHRKLVAFPLADPAGGENLKDSLVMELDNPTLQAAARVAAGDEKDAYAAARRVVAWVGTHMENNYGASADRASDALKNMKGDCTEHSLLSVAMLRTLGIPAKRVDGLVYVEQADRVPAMYWHEWVEAYVGEWTQLDPTFSEAVTDAAHLALGEETHEDIVQLMGQLKVVDVRQATP